MSQWNNKVWIRAAISLLFFFSHLAPLTHFKVNINVHLCVLFWGDFLVKIHNRSILIQVCVFLFFKLCANPSRLELRSLKFKLHLDTFVQIILLQRQRKKKQKKNLNKFKKRKPIKCNNNYDLLLSHNN